MYNLFWFCYMLQLLFVDDMKSASRSLGAKRVSFVISSQFYASFCYQIECLVDFMRRERAWAWLTFSPLINFRHI